MRAGGEHCARRRLPGVETRKAKRRHSRGGGTCGALNTLQVPAISVPAVCHCLLSECSPSFLIFCIRPSSFFFLCSLRFLTLPPLSSLLLFCFLLFFCIFMQLNKQTKQISRTLQAPHVLPAQTVNRNNPQSPSVLSAAPVDCISV